MNVIDDVRQSIAAGKALHGAQTQALLAAYDETLEELERLRGRIGDLEFHYEVFEHLMLDRKLMIEKFAQLGLEIYSVPDTNTGTWCWAWRWRNGPAHTGYERSIHALIAAVEALLTTKE
jgi:hypothetical protein